MKLHQRLSKRTELLKLHLKHYHMSSAQFRRRTSVVASFSAKRGGGIYYFLRKKFENKVRKKFGGHQSSKCWFEKSSGGQTALPEFENKVRKKFGGKKSSKCWCQKNSGGQTALPEFENKVRKKFEGKKVRNAGSKKVRGAKLSGLLGSKKVRLQRGCTNSIRNIFKQRRRFQKKSSTTTIPRSRRHIQGVIWIFFEIHHCQRSFGELFLKPTLNAF